MDVYLWHTLIDLNLRHCILDIFPFGYPNALPNIRKCTYLLKHIGIEH